MERSSVVGRTFLAGRQPDNSNASKGKYFFMRRKSKGGTDR
ncbi:hypothetical protein CLV45_3639 [Hymenobacter chitinivorans DSM 11115]|uniref:Uncharacterized protein n=1 Tax=Hymenobacter chitinivorans DSM 11115 TaxID=1121954 RepID=A0A2M9B4W6_9BACT|nr:hypothetical protein CLV45_3639 [Hymenobacter chitinivorans DSM 11115]